MGKFRQCLTELSARDTILAGYYSLMFLFVYTICHSLFALPLGVICKLCSVIVAIPEHLYYFAYLSSLTMASSAR